LSYLCPEFIHPGRSRHCLLLMLWKQESESRNHKDCKRSFVCFPSITHFKIMLSKPSCALTCLPRSSVATRRVPESEPNGEKAKCQSSWLGLRPPAPATRRLQPFRCSRLEASHRPENLMVRFFVGGSGWRVLWGELGHC
jgi:hypothetical protein